MKAFVEIMRAVSFEELEGVEAIEGGGAGAGTGA
jgi:hypothetical protein